MPIFEYRCQDCGSTFEKLVRRPADSAELACPQCGQTHLKQEFSTFAAHANGASKEAAPMGGCAAGMCRTPDICGRN
jgi:putative FmdB family regulatory protein